MHTNNFHKRRNFREYVESVDKDCYVTATSQLPHEWRRLVGSIRRRVRGKTPATAATAAPSNDKMPALMTSSDPAVRDDFLRATMRIFLVVSPPMGRLQVTHRVRAGCILYTVNLTLQCFRSSAAPESERTTAGQDSHLS